MSGTEKSRRGELVGNAAVFVAGYLVTLVAVFLMTIVNDPSGWTHFIVAHYPDLISLMISVFFLYLIIYLYFYFEDRGLLSKVSNTALVFTLLVLCTVICYVFGKYVNLYARPYALFAILCIFLFNRRHALFLNFIFAALMFTIDLFGNNVVARELTSEIYATLLVGFVSGTFAVFYSGGVKTRVRMLLTGVIIAIPTIFVVFFFQIPNTALTWQDYLITAAYRILGCAVSAVLSLALLPLFEAMFNRLTVFRLRELTSTNAALLSRLQKEAPGTFNHSIIVAQLSEVCAAAIGEDAELARAAAYYHDVGKLKQPDCFTENQTDYNVHDELTPELSADIIRSHAKDGYELLVEARLPQIIADVAREHHGTLPIKYFYDKAMKISGGDANVRDYSYLGPTPQTKIAAIVMIADASEAATRAVGNRTPESVEKVVRSIIEERMDLDQFAQCDITMKELTVIKQTLVDALTGVHHRRVKYPSIRFTRGEKTVRDTEHKDE